MEPGKPAIDVPDVGSVPSSIAPPPDPAPDASSSWPNLEMLARIAKLVGFVVEASCLPEEREDSLQNALLRYWQLARENPGKSTSWYLVRCRGFIQDRLKRGTSVDSPKRRRLGCSIDVLHEGDSPGMPELVSEINPAEMTSVLDALEEMRVRLDGRENAILELLIEGDGTREVAQNLNISPAAVSNRRRRIRSVAREIGFFREDLRTRGK
jgi:hypothetical protein